MFSVKERFASGLGRSPYLSGRANLELLAALDRGGVGSRETDEILELVELRERAGSRVGLHAWTGPS